MQRIKIFLASSRELQDHRREFEIFVGRKNKEWVSQGVFLELLIWEDFLDALAKTRLQDKYNQAIRECDIFVMLFRTRVGKYTEEEFTTAVGQFKATSRPLVFTFFNDADISLSSVDRNDLKTLWAFQEKLKELEHFCPEYRTADELKLRFTQQLDKLVSDGFIRLKRDESEAAFRNVKRSSEDSAEAESVIAAYLHALANDLARVELGKIDASANQSRQTPLKLADIYVPLNTTLQILEDATLPERLSRPRNLIELETRDRVVRRNEMRPVSALQVLAKHRELTLLGKPGSGKSTFGASVLLALAQARQGHADELKSLGEEWKFGALLPVRVVLRRFAEQLPLSDQPASAGDLWAFIGRDLEARGYGLSVDTMKYVQSIARNQGALILFDGLDECGDSIRRDRVLHAVRELMGSAGKLCRFVLTARPYAWPGGPDPAKGVHALADFNTDQTEQFIRAWYAALERHNWCSPGDAERKRDDLLRAWRRPDLLPLARNPLLLSLMASLHTNRGRLPDDRADLYDDSVNLLMQRWNESTGADRALLDELAIPCLKLADLREVLEELAFKVHEQNAGQAGTADVGEDQLVRAFCPLLSGSKDKADVVVDYIENRAGLLIGQGEKGGERQFTFPHRSFQEFLAACHLAARDNFPEECARLTRSAPDHWQVVLPLAARIAKVERGASAADELIGGISIEEFRSERQPETLDWVRTLLAGMQLQELGPSAFNKSPRTLAISRRVAGWLAASLPLHPRKGGMTAGWRTQAGDVLSALGDPRFDPQRFYLPADELLGFMRIPADPDFMIGTRRSDAKVINGVTRLTVVEDEINDVCTPTPEFYISRYPVTVAQFRAFIEHGGKVEVALLDPASRPVRNISWYEALAYCEWLNHQLATSSLFEQSYVARLVRKHSWRAALPSELEWEKAARGRLRSALFPWGNEPDREMAAFDEMQLGNTSVVGCFPANHFGLYDMSGNVWEWTRSLWGTDGDESTFRYPYDPVDPDREDTSAASDVLRVMRGGSFDSLRINVRCAYRFRAYPGDRVNMLGFRVVLRPPPVH